MDRGHIPGYYFDEEKQKYFKIQQEHRAPAGAKYSINNVKREERDLKRQKTAHRLEEARTKNRITRSLILQHPLLGQAGLYREHGVLRPAQVLASNNAAFVGGLKLTKQLCISLVPGVTQGQIVYDKYAPALAAQYIPATQEMIVQVRQINGWGGFPYDLIGFKFSAERPTDFQKPVVTRRAYLNPPTLISVWDAGRTIFAASAKYITWVVQTHDFTRSPAREIVADGYSQPELRVIRPDNEPLGVAVCDLTGSTAVRQLRKIDIFDEKGTAFYRVSVEDGTVVSDDIDGGRQSTVIDWLDHDTFAYVCNTKRRDRTVMLCDVRAPDSETIRFRNRFNITGLAAADESRGRLLISDNRKVKLFDTRMGNKSVWSIDHTHGGPELQFATNKQGIFAAVDRDNHINVYSLTNGSLLGNLEHNLSKRPSKHITCLRWYSGGTVSPGFTACHGDYVAIWRWDGATGKNLIRSTLNDHDLYNHEYYDHDHSDAFMNLDSMC